MPTQTIQFVANTVGPFRVRNIKGVSHTVLDMVMLVAGVHTGNLGPLLYTDEQMAKTADAWNMMPLVRNHPVDTDGKPISARQIEVLDTASFGNVLNSKHKPTVGDVPGSLFCEAWVNMAELAKVDSDMADRIARNETIEISTGLTLDIVEESGEWNGTPYTGRVTNFRPDHVAFLPNDTGACSIAKGCGVGTKVLVNKTLANCSCSAKAENAEVLPVTATDLRSEYVPTGSFLVGNTDVSFATITSKAGAWVEENHPAQHDADGKATKRCYLEFDAVYPDYFVYSEYKAGQSPEFYRVDYSLNARGLVIVDAATEVPVTRQVTYVPTLPDSEQESDMTTNTAPATAPVAPEVIATPVATPVQNTETPAPLAVAPVAAPVAIAPVAPQLPLTINAFIATAPVEHQGTLEDALLALNTAKGGFVSKITAVPTNTFTAEALNAMRLPQLSAIAGLIAEPVAAPVVPVVATNAAPAVAPRTLNYSGAAGAPVTNSAGPAPRLLTTNTPQ